MKKTLVVCVMCVVMMAVLLVLGSFSFPYANLVYTGVSVVLFSVGGIVLKFLSPDETPRRFFKFRRPKMRNFFLVFWTTLMLVLGSFMLNFATGFVLDEVGIAPPSSALASLGAEDLVLSLLTVAVVPAVCEEIFFRGAVHSYLYEKGAVFAVFVSAALFCIMHGPDWYFLSTLYAGVVFAMLVQVTGSVYSSMIVHFFNNVLSTVLVFYADRLAQVKMDAYLCVAAVVLFLVSAIAFVSIVLRRYKNNIVSEQILSEEEITL